MKCLLAIGFCSACVSGVELPNGLDGELQFSPSAYEPALGTTNHIFVGRLVDKPVCIDGWDGKSCASPSYVPAAIDAVSCSDGCTATIEVDASGESYVDVTTSVEDATLAATLHARDGSGTWTDRYPVHFERATGLEVIAIDGEPIGVAYATEPDARTVVYACPVGSGGYCLDGSFTTEITGDAVAEVAPAPVPDSDTSVWPPSYTSIHLASAGTGTVHIRALGIDRALAFRAPAPSEWTAVEFMRIADDVATHDIGETGFLGPKISALTIRSLALTSDIEVVATAVIADGSRVLISAAHLECTPADRVVIAGRSTDVGSWRSRVVIANAHARSPGDATCTVAGHAELGALTVHVEP